MFKTGGKKQATEECLTGQALDLQRQHVLMYLAVAVLLRECLGPEDGVAATR